MRTPLDIYAQYNIMKNLQEHQLRVAAVGKMLCDHLALPVRTDDVILAGLFHDMGNIIKFDLSKFPEFRKPEGVEYWQKVKDEYVSKYGTDEHGATERIAVEIGLPERIVEMYRGLGFSKLDQIRLKVPYEYKLVQYGDLRSAPHGILPMKERIEEAAVRYNYQSESEEAQERSRLLIQSAHELERQIFSVADISPEDITDERIAPVIEELKVYPIR
jgi:5'-deoxynucleotidase YfbR-like HD superfamily hydrolase